MVRRLWATAGRVGSIGPASAAGRRFGALRRRQHHLLPAGTDVQRALHPHRRGHDDRRRRAAVGRDGARPGVPHRPGRAHRRSLPDRRGTARSSATSRSTSATTCGPARTCTSPTRTTATRTSTEPISRQTQPERQVVIGAGSWLGHGTVVLPGARIGRHVTVGAGSVVSGELPDFCVAVGSPAQVVRRHDGTQWVRPSADRRRGRISRSRPARPAGRSGGCRCRREVGDHVAHRPAGGLRLAVGLQLQVAQRAA